MLHTQHIFVKRVLSMDFKELLPRRWSAPQRLGMFVCQHPSDVWLSRALGTSRYCAAAEAVHMYTHTYT